MNFIKLTYRGRKTYRDKFMGLTWEPGSTQLVTAEAARQLVKFVEFETAGKAEKAEKPKQAEQDEQTQAAVLAEKQAAKAREDQDDQLRNMLTTVDSMDKDALEAYAMKYEVNLDKRRSLQTLRDEVTLLIEQYGVR